MKVREKVFVFFTFLLSCVAIALLAISLGTQHWVVASAVRTTNEKSSGTINFGLFRGTRRLNHGFGERVYSMNVFEVQYRERDFLVRELYVCTIASVSAAILFGIMAAALSLLNTAGSPEEAMCHMPGVIGINIVAFVFSLVGVITWLVQFYSRLRTNVLLREDKSNGHWTSEGRARVGYSFWMVFIACAMFFANTVIVLLLQRRRAKRSFVKSQVIESATKPNGNLMLY